MFKIGDKVILTEVLPSMTIESMDKVGLRIGKEYIICSVNSRNNLFAIKGDNYEQWFAYARNLTTKVTNNNYSIE